VQVDLDKFDKVTVRIALAAMGLPLTLCAVIALVRLLLLLVITVPWP
jgi:hypothetical protein